MTQPLPGSAPPTGGVRLWKRKPRILRLLIEAPETNAPFHQLSVPLADRHDITICTYFPSASEAPPSIKMYEGDRTLRGFWSTLKRALRAGPYDIVHAHTPHVALIFLAAAGWRPGALRKAVFTVHNCYENHRTRNKWLLVPVFLTFRRIIFCGRAAQDSFPTFFRRLGGRRMSWVANGVPYRRIQEAGTRDVAAPTEGTFEIISVSRLVPIKNVMTLLRAVSQLDGGATLTVVGDGAERAALKAWASARRLESRVDFTGLLGRDDVYRRMFRSSLFVSVSHGEGLPVAVLEAMAVGCPVILSDIAPHREIADGVDFIPLIKPDDEEGLEREIRRLQSMPCADRERIGAQCQALVMERFSLESMHAGYEAHFAQLAPHLSYAG